MLRIYFGLLLFLCFPLLALGANQESYSSPSQLPHVKSQMLTAGFWISQHTSVDKIVLTPVQIDAFNNNVRNQLKVTKDIFSITDNFQTEALVDVFNKSLESFKSKGYYTFDGTQNNIELLEKAKNNEHLSGLVLGVAPRYGIVVSNTDQRFLPTIEGLYAQKGGIDFDELQNSGLNLGTAVAVVHQSRDRKWLYVLSALSDGWVEAKDIAIADVKAVKNFVQAKEFIVVTSPKADIFLDEQMTRFQDYVRMGVKLPLLEENNNGWVIQLPIKDKEGQLQLKKGYIPKQQAHRGYLPYTARAIYTQAFLMLDKPYGWGDMKGHQDCSRFLQMVYATVGIELPRDSKNQAQVGEEIVSFGEKVSNKEKLEGLIKVQGALIILPMKGHIMLYLGNVNGIPFVIHETSGYSQTKGEMQVKYTLNRVVVSDLSLGENSAKGSLLRRLTKIVEVK
ncbi:MAG: SH3 domain-containing protein [Candidatus Omnitrophota bacterium]